MYGELLENFKSNSFSDIAIDNIELLLAIKAIVEEIDKKKFRETDMDTMVSMMIEEDYNEAEDKLLATLYLALFMYFEREGADKKKIVNKKLNSILEGFNNFTNISKAEFPKDIKIINEKAVKDAERILKEKEPKEKKI